MVRPRFIRSHFKPWFILMLFVACLFTGLSSNSASAVDLSKFQAGYIISDSIFTKKDSLSVSQIQSFLNSKVPSCDTNGTKPAGDFGRPDLTHAQYAASRGWQSPPYTCLKNFSQSGKSAAQIIYDKAQEFSISPKVLIVLLQKEQALVTDTWPLNNQFKTATGYGCPDTAPCDSEYYGFVNQVTWAARMFRAIMNNSPTWYTPYELGNNQIPWHPNTSSCGYSTVNIVNRATQALYNYTPYRPNQAALNAGYGSGNSCSSYGNRNFFAYFTDWFGTTYGTPFFKVDGNKKVYMSGADNTYYYVPNSSILEAYGYGSIFSQVQTVPGASISSDSLAGTLSLVAQFETDTVYAVNGRSLHRFVSESSLTSYGFSPSDVAQLPSWVGALLPISNNIEPILALSDSKPIYHVIDGKKRHITGGTAYNTLGTPVYSSRPSVSMSSDFAALIDDGAPILIPETVVKTTDTNRYGIWDGSNLLLLQAQVGAQLGLSPGYQAPSTSINQLPISSTDIGIYVKDSSNKYYLLDRLRSKIALSDANLALLGLPTNLFTSLSSSFLSSLTTKPLPSLVRVMGGDHIYIIDEKEVLRIYGRGDFDGLGYQSKDVIDIATTTFNLFDDNGKLAFKQGRLINIDQQKHIYLINNSSRVLVPSKDLMAAYGYGFEDVFSVTEANSTNYPVDPQPLQRYAKDSSGTYWLIDGSKRYKIKYSLVGSNYSVTNSKTLSTANIVALPRASDATEFIKTASNSRLYWVKDGKKRWISSPAVFQDLGGTSSNVTLVSQSFLDSITTGLKV